MKKLPDPPIQVGDVFGSITIIEDRVYLRVNSNSVMVRGKCICGTEKIFRLFHLKSGHTKTCGCGRSSYKATHGLRSNLAYTVWSALRSKAKKGEVKMEIEWRDSFTAFLAGVGERPSLEHRLKLIDKRFGYRPGNCEWIVLEKKKKFVSVGTERLISTVPEEK